MNPSDKMQLLKNYSNRRKADGVSAIEIGHSLVRDNLESSLSEDDETKQPSVSIRNDASVNGKKLMLDSEPYKFDTVVLDTPDIDLDDDDFRPLSFNTKVMSADEQSKSTYEEIKQFIMSIDCSRGLESAYAEFDNTLLSMSSDASSDLTNSQILILVSTMIVKLEELNSYNYPELDLNAVKDKLDNEGKRAVTSNNFEQYFFTSFFTHYQTIELEQFNKLKETYSSKIEQFSNFQQKKGEMLMTLLKWLIN